MNPQIVVRQAEQSDAAVIEAHLRMAKDESHQYRGTPFALNDAPTRTYVAIVGDTPVGSLSLIEEIDGNATICLVFVEAEAREIGVGDTLLSYAMKDLVGRGFVRISASAQPGDRSLKNLFERHGLVAQTILVGRSLSDLSTEARASQ